MYSRQPGRPTAQLYEVIALAVSIAQIAINRDAVEKALLESQAQLLDAQSISHLGHYHWDAKSKVVDWSVG